MITNRIYTYFIDIGWAIQADVVELWKERWRAEGWDPVVLGEKDAQKDWRYDALKKKVFELPCRPGAKNFERVSFERWLAFAGIDEPGPVTDFDVFPIRPFPPRSFDPLPVCGDGAGGPGFVVGSGADFSKVVDAILAYEVEPDDVCEGQPHVSDMTVLKKRQKDLYRIQVMVFTYGQQNFGTEPLAHYGNASLDVITDHHTGMPKAEAIRRLLQQHYRRE